MLKRTYCLTLALLVFLGTVTPARLLAEETEPVPYEIGEFPRPVRELRRGEIIFFGSVPITFLLSGLSWELGQAAAGDSYPFSDEQHTYNILISAGALSLGIALLDFILGRLE